MTMADTTNVNAMPTTSKIDKWAGIAGRWSFSNSQVEYQGPESELGRFGIALAADRMKAGTVRLKYRLSSNQETTAGIIFGYRSINSPYYIAEVGAWDRAYAIAEFRPERGWFALQAVGLLSNIDINKEHELSVSIQGQNVRLIGDGVEVLNTTLERPIEGVGLGLFAFGTAGIQFSDISATIRMPRVFVIMPFAEPFDTLYREVILPVCTQLGFNVLRIDEVNGPGVILDDIQREIVASDAVVAEISNHNPNVFYELGYAHALGKPAVLLVRRQEGKDMPFDIRGYRAIFYDDTIGGKRTVERRLREHLAAILDTGA